MLYDMIMNANYLHAVCNEMSPVFEYVFAYEFMFNQIDVLVQERRNSSVLAIK